MPAIKSYPMQIVRVRRARPLRHPLRRILRPRHATGAAPARMPVKLCAAARLVVDKLFRD
jgi:hypothetical protein